jgi:SSS family solute:Na+ symporter
MVPAAVQILTASTLFIKNVCRPILAPSMTDVQVANLARISVLAITALAMGFAIHSSTSLVGLLLIGFAGVAQFFPGVVLGLYTKRVTTVGVFGGLVCGVSIVAFLILTKRDPLGGWNAGFLGLCSNFAVTVAISLLRPAPQQSLAANSL